MESGVFTPKIWLKSFLIGTHRFTYIKDKGSSKLPITHMVSQGSVLGPLPFILYINDHHKAIQHSSVHHFADDTNLLYTSKSLNKINKHINHDIKHLCHKAIQYSSVHHFADDTNLLYTSKSLNKINKHINHDIKHLCHKAIQYSSVHHFADDTNLLYTSKSLNKINKHINHDIKHLCQWLQSNKISLNASKTEMIIIKTKLKTISKHLNFRVRGQKINPTSSVKYLGIHLNNYLQTKQNRAIGLLSRIRHDTPKSLLKTTYFSLFNSSLIYAYRFLSKHFSTASKR